QGHGARGENLRLTGAHVANREVDLRAGVSTLVPADFGGDAGVGQGAGSTHGIAQLHVVRGSLASEAHGVNGNVASAQRVNGIRTDASRVVVAVTEKHYASDRQVGSLVA